MSTEWIEKLEGVSSKPGVYLMRDAEGTVIYVGKAGNLKKRLASYFKHPEHPDLKTGILVKKIADFDTLITENETEALILESNLIKRHRPRYNVILKDDKRYPSLRIDPRRPYPTLERVRKIEKDGAFYFGPYVSSQSLQETVRTIDKTFKLRKCGDPVFRSRTRPCLNHQIGLCLGPCCLPVDPAEYEELVREVVLFLKGRTPELLRKLKSRMSDAAESRNYEAAAAFRDRMYAVERTLQKQVSVTTDFMDRDVVAVAGRSGLSVIQILFVRGGFLQGSRHYTVEEPLSTDAETLGAFIRQYYEKGRQAPKEILVPVEMEDADLLSDWLAGIKGEKVRIHRPQRGEKTQLVEMAVRNAEKELGQAIDTATSNAELLVRLKIRLGMERLPRRIECFDNSVISGTDPVAGMVVFDDLKPDKGAYRRYIIKDAAARTDDYAYMAEVVRRRYGKGAASEPFPDLLMVDGGKGQLNIALSVLADLGIEGRMAVIGIAKKDEAKGETEEKIFTPGRANPLNFPGKDRDLLLYLQRIRDEAHRFAVAFHRRRRGKSSVRSVLDGVPGIGKKRKRMLLRHFGGIKKIRAATLEELRALPGMTRPAAEALQARLKGRDGTESGISSRGS